VAKLRCHNFAAVTEEDHPDMRELLNIFRDKTFAVHQPMSNGANYRIRTIIRSYKDPLVQRYNYRAEELSVRATFDQTWRKKHVKFEHEFNVPRSYHDSWFGADQEPGAIFEDDVEQSEDEDEMAYQGEKLEDDPMGNGDHHNHDSEQPYSMEATPLPPSPRLISFPVLADVAPDLPALPVRDYQTMPRRRPKVYANKDTPEPFQRRPECRKYYELLTSSQGLQHHLEALPKHRIPFKGKAYNTLNYWAEHGGRRKCWTCAKSFVSLGFLAAHLGRDGHRRRGMILR
jgi:hypothetical protein